MNWRKREEHGKLFSDGETMLVAVPVCKDSKDPKKGNKWELHVIVIACDEDYFSLRRPNGESWDDFDWSDVEYWLPFKDVTIGLPPA